MRMVADRAGVSVGNAYYYFESKELLLQAFYREVHEAHVAASRSLLVEERDVKKRLMAVMLAKLEVTEPYHRFAGLMFRTAADPKSPLNPFHEASKATRAEGIELFAEVLRDSKLKIPKALAAELPGLLWTYSMGIVLYWIHDDSTGREQTRKLTEHTVDIVVRCLRLASNPLMRPLRGRVLAMLKDLDSFAS